MLALFYYKVNRTLESHPNHTQYYNKSDIVLKLAMQALAPKYFSNLANSECHQAQIPKADALVLHWPHPKLLYNPEHPIKA